MYLDTSTFTLTDRPGQAHTKPSHIPTVENISHTLLFFLKVHLTHTQAGTCKNVDTHRTNMQFVQNGMYVCKTT